MLTKEDLIEFEKDISDLFLDKKIKVPIHLSGGNENHLLQIFKLIHDDDWVLSTHRNHYHALLKGIPKEELRKIILDGESMHIYDKKRRFLTSAIVGGVLPIGLGIAMGIKRREEENRVFVFVGDMAAETGIFHECSKYARRHALPITFIIEDNGYSTDAPTQESWGLSPSVGYIIKYKYDRMWPHVGVGEWITF